MSEDKFLIQLLGKIGDDIARINDTIDRNQDRINGYIIESSTDRKALRSLIDGLHDRVEKLSKMLGGHKKKGVWALFVATLTGGAIASGTLNYQELFKSLLPFKGD
jgi:hypothetical protein